MIIRFVYDIVCPFAYLAFRQLDLVRRHAAVELHPVLLGGLLRHVGAPDDPNAVMAPARAAVNRRDILAWADFWGVTLSIPRGHPRRSVEAMRILAAAPEDQREAWTATVFRAYWEQGLDIADRDVLREVMAPHGADAEALIEAGREVLRHATADAHAAGAFGVPTFLGGPRLLWGQDRIGLLLRDLGAEVSLDAWAEPASGPRSAVTSLRFVHDFASPFSYLAATQIDRVAAEAGVEVEYAPILLGALFRAIGTPNVPLHAMNPTRQAYAGRDLGDWAQGWGVPFRFPSHFPMRSVLPLRASIVEPACVPVIYRAAWAEDLRVDTPQTLGPVLEAAGFDAEAILAKTADPSVKLALREHTERAQADGICGVPTCVLTYEDGRVLKLWGQDRLLIVRAALRGWVPPRAISP